MAIVQLIVKILSITPNFIEENDSAIKINKPVKLGRCDSCVDRFDCNS